jgi:hypothetical protein
VKRNGNQLIRDVRIAAEEPWQSKMLRTLDRNYRRAAHFEVNMSWLEPLILRDESSIASYNIANIQEIARQLGLQCQFRRQSDLSGAEVFAKKGSERLAAVCAEVGGTIYLAGDGADDYENAAIYEKAGIELWRNNFRSIPYRHVNPHGFIPGLSVLDALFNAGLDRTRQFLTKDQGEILRVD